MSEPKVAQQKGVTTRFRPGERRVGRAPGTPNKATVAVKEALRSVYADLQAETGEEHGHFRQWAKETPTEFYKLYAKLLPVDINATVAAVPHEQAVAELE